MELDDQLAALAAGELDAADARALQARVAADPALATRLARFEQLQAVLTGWATPELSDAAVARLDHVLGEALNELDDGPLTAATPRRGAGLRALPDTDLDEDPPVAAAASTAARGTVTDLAAAREERGVPTWMTRVGVAAALVAVVGIGVTLAGQGDGTGGMDTMASDDAAESLRDEAATTESDAAADGEMAEEGASSDVLETQPMEEPAADTAQLAPRRTDGVVIEQGELLSLLLAATDDGSTAGGTTDDGQEEDPATCVDEALTRDSDPDGERAIDQLATGTYAGEDAVFVVLREPGPDGDTFTVFAYAPTDCRLLDAATTSS